MTHTASPHHATAALSRCLRRAAGLAVLILTLVAASCTDDVQDLYAHQRAFFRFDQVSTTHPLYTALHSPGEWCTIQVRNVTYLFTSAKGETAQANATAMQAYGRPECVAGFIVGTPSVPDLKGQTPVLAFDLVCPTCYEESAVQRSVSFTGTERVQCPRCSRTYDLKQGGIVVAGPAGLKLYRYHVSTSDTGSGTLLINN